MTPIYVTTTIDMPLDLQIQILLRLSVKSLLRFRCVSKLWSSIIASRDFGNRHLNITYSKAPRLLIAFENVDGENLLLVSLPNPNASSSSCVPYRDLSLFEILEKDVRNMARGMICFGRGLNVKICNPSTRKLLMLPQIKFKSTLTHTTRPSIFSGYDPVKDQYKVLAFNSLRLSPEHKVLVLGEDNGWREIASVAYSHDVHTTGMYMNGTIYYGAFITDFDYPNDVTIVSFDVRLEKFNIINVPSKVLPMGYENRWISRYLWLKNKTLINYKGKIGVVENPHKGSFQMWVVEDAEREEWSVNTFHLPESVVGIDFKVMDTFYTGEICLVPKMFSDLFCLYYYNMETKSIRRVVIEGLPISEFKQGSRHIYVTVSDHYENLMFLET